MAVRRRRGGADAWAAAGAHGPAAGSRRRRGADFSSVCLCVRASSGVVLWVDSRNSGFGENRHVGECAVARGEMGRKWSMARSKALI